MALDQRLKSLEQQKTQVLSQGLSQDQARAAVQGIERQAESVKQQLGQELKTMEMQPPRISMEGMKAEGARAASEFVKASGVAQQAFHSAMAAGGGNQEIQKTVAAVKAAIEAAQALSNPVSLAKTAVHVAKHVITMER